MEKEIPFEGDKESIYLMGLARAKSEYSLSMVPGIF